MTGRQPENSAEDFAPLVELAEAFSALVDLLRVGDSASISAPQIVGLATAVLTTARHADLSVLERGRQRSIASSSGLPDRLQEIRRAVGEGPSLDVLDTNDVVFTNDLATDVRWPRFAARVVDTTDIRSIVSYRLYLGPDHRAALTFYSDWPHAFDDVAVATGAILAAYCSLVLLTELVLRDSVTSRRAADVHREIGVAVAILMTHHDLSADAAYQRLHEASRALHRSLPDVARAVADGRELPRDGDGVRDGRGGRRSAHGERGLAAPDRLPDDRGARYLADNE